MSDGNAPGLPAVPRGFLLRYYLYRATAAVGFTAPIWYVYLEATTGSLALAAAASAIWRAGLIVFEIPTGYVGDRIGRRRALLVGTVVTVLGMTTMAFVDSFLAVAVIFAAWAVGSTFRSGTADAWLYEMLAERLDEAAFARVRGRGGTVAAVTMGVTALLGGYVAAGRMADAFLVSAGATALGLPVLWSLPDSPADVADAEFTVLDALPVLRRQFARPPLRSFVLLVALYSGVHWGVNFFIQPVSMAQGITPAGLGWMFAGFTAVTGAVSYFAGDIRERVGVATWFRAVPVALGAAFLAVAAVPLLAVPVFFLMRGLRGAALPLANQFINDHAGDVGRATVLSAAGMAYSLVTVPFELTAGVLAETIGLTPTVGLFGAVLLAGSLGVLAVGRPFARAADGVAVAGD